MPGLILPVSVIPMQPEPTTTQVIHLKNATVIARIWDLQLIARCQLCPKGQCSADASGLCLIVEPRIVAFEDAPLFRSRGAAGGHADSATG